MALLTLRDETLPGMYQEKKDVRQDRGTLANAWFTWRSAPHFGVLEAVILAAYAAIVVAVIPAHAPWSDEAQAWLIARDSSTWDILWHRLHYEGAPPLWHLLLHAFHLAGGTYAGIGYFGAVFALAGMAIWLRWSPFPLVIRVLLPFTFFFLYQYAIIARSYVLFAPLAFSLCIAYRRKNHLLFAVIAGLLANLCLQGLLLAFVILVFYLLDLYRAHTFLPLSPPRRLVSFFLFDVYRSRVLSYSRRARRTLVISAGVLAIMTVLGVFIAYPAPDISFSAATGGGGGLVHDAMAKLIGETPRTQPFAPWDPYLFPKADPAKPLLLRNPLQWAAWQINYRDFVDVQGHYGPQTFGSQALEFVVGAASQATFPIAVSNLVACAFLALLIAWLRRRRALFALLPWAVIIFVGQILWVADHHAGMILIALLAGVWIAVQRPGIRPAPPLLDRGFLAFFAVILFLQIGWSMSCIHKEFNRAYDPGRETARFLKSNPVATTAAFHFQETAIQPYFKRNPFFNIPRTYWLWSYNVDPDPHHRATLAAHPDRVVLTIEFPGTSQMRNQWAPVSRFATRQEEQYLPREAIANNLRDRGYRETHRFCGERFARLGTSYRDCDIIFEPASSCTFSATSPTPPKPIASWRLSAGTRMHPFTHPLSRHRLRR